MRHDHVLKRLTFDLLIHPWGRRSAGKLFATMLLHSDSLKFDMQHEIVLKTFWPLGSGGLRAEYLLPCFYISWIHLMCNATWPCSEKVEQIDPIHRVGVGKGVGVTAGKIFCYHVAAFEILFNLICNMTMFWKSWILTFWSHPLGSFGREVCGQNICYHVAAFHNSL